MSKEGIKPEILVYVKIDKQWINIAEELVRLGLASESSSLGMYLKKTLVKSYLHTFWLLFQYVRLLV